MRSAGSARSFEFTPSLPRRVPMRAHRWLVSWWEDDTWRTFIAPMPEGAAASYADCERRYAGAICMELIE